SSSAGVSENQAGDTLVLPLRDEAALKALFEREGDHIAAIIVEPLPANFGLLPLTSSFLETLRSLSKAHGALLIFDEVISGFRVALGGMAQVSNIAPDLVTYGKVIGGGFPVGAFAGRAEIMDFIAPEGPVYQAGTLSANPISMRAGLVTLKKAAQPGNYELLNQRTDRFANALEGLITKTGVDIKLVHSGSLLWMCPGAKDMDIHGPEDFPADLQSRFKPFFLSLLEQGIYVAPSGYEVMFLSHAHTDEVLEEALKKFERAFENFRK
ncbi:MAG TPA: aminotransferase class III-fold pyridoxal phosphate-dependent enzyme, partial [Devosia sp.]|nr:aminotransferase class III-fold pyridoxal phosphate-dependent enzyme [Devosia sp.]